MVKKPTVISLFAGCGGSSLGYKMAGYKEVTAVEFWELAATSLKKNFPDTNVIVKDIKLLSGKDIGTADVLDGSPPCQGFSAVGKSVVSDERNNLVMDYIRLVEEINPKVFVMENVSGMLKGSMKGLFNKYLKEMRKLDYIVKVKLMNAMYYQVPQSRKRVIFVGIRKDIKKEFQWPVPSKKIITVRDVIGDYKLTEEEIKVTNIPDHYNVLHYAKQCKEGELACKYHPKGYYFTTRKLDRNKPSPTVLKTAASSGTNFLMHYNQLRNLSITEVKRLCSFPDDYFLEGKYRNQWEQLGNSVPPKMMKSIAESVKKLL